SHELWVAVLRAIFGTGVPLAHAAASVTGPGHVAQDPSGTETPARSAGIELAPRHSGLAGAPGKAAEVCAPPPPPSEAIDGVLSRATEEEPVQSTQGVAGRRVGLRLPPGHGHQRHEDPDQHTDAAEGGQLASARGTLTAACAAGKLAPRAA